MVDRFKNQYIQTQRLSKFWNQWTETLKQTLYYKYVQPLKNTVITNEQMANIGRQIKT